MKVLAYILTAAAVLIGAEVFVDWTGDATTPDATTEQTTRLGTMEGGNGIPPPPPD